MSYTSNKKTKAKIDSLLEKNAAYQAANVCVTNNFINPIKDIDVEFFSMIALG